MQPEIQPAAMPHASCLNHERRPAVALCMGCREQFCGECLTRVQGIHYCQGCYDQQAPAREAARPPALRPVLDAMVLLGWATALSGALWGLLEIAFWP